MSLTRFTCSHWNASTAIWPHYPPLQERERIQVEHFAQSKRDAEAIDLLSRTIGPLFYRVRKQDLNLAPQMFHPPTRVQMRKYERMVYDAILDRLRILSKEDYFRDIDLLIRLRRGRMMRLRQTTSYAKLLGTAVLDYNEILLEDSPSLADIIKHYDEIEIPAKLTALTEMVNGLRARSEKVLVWSNFVQSLKLISNHLQKEGHGVRLIYGETPTERTDVEEQETREQIISTRPTSLRPRRGAR